MVTLSGVLLELYGAVFGCFGANLIKSLKMACIRFEGHLAVLVLPADDPAFHRPKTAGAQNLANRAPKKTPIIGNNRIKSTKYIKLFYTYRIDGKPWQKLPQTVKKNLEPWRKNHIKTAWDKIAWQAKN